MGETRARLDLAVNPDSYSRDFAREIFIKDKNATSCSVFAVIIIWPAVVRRSVPVLASLRCNFEAWNRKFDTLS